MRIKKRKHSLSISFLFFLSLSPSFFCSLFLSSSLYLSNADVLHILSHTNAPASTRHHRIQRQEGETYTVLKRMLTLKMRRENVPNSLSLPQLPPLHPPLLHILSLSSLHVTYIDIDIMAHALLKEGCQCLNILLLSSLTHERGKHLR